MTKVGSTEQHYKSHSPQNPPPGGDPERVLSFLVGPSLSRAQRVDQTANSDLTDRLVRIERRMNKKFDGVGPNRPLPPEHEGLVAVHRAGVMVPSGEGPEMSWTRSVERVLSQYRTISTYLHHRIRELEEKARYGRGRSRVRTEKKVIWLRELRDKWGMRR